jgi:uncharacterized protein YcbK (DUF882 family)
MYRMLVSLALGWLLCGLPTSDAHAGSAKASQASSSKSAKSTKSTKAKSKAKSKSKAKLVCKGKGKKRTCRRVKFKPVITSRGVPEGELRAAPLARPSGHVHVFSAITGTEVEVDIFKADGSYNMDALAKLDAMWACRRTKEVRAVDPRLYEVLSTLHDTYGKRVELHSGFRFQQNEGSRHFHASAMDVRIVGVPWKELAAFAETLDPGGMGIGRYPNMGFVHIDFRAPGERSVRWNDTSKGTDTADPGKRPSQSWRRSVPKS